jgi:hypothetical protein
VGANVHYRQYIAEGLTKFSLRLLYVAQVRPDIQPSCYDFFQRP